MKERDVLYDAVKTLVDMSFNQLFRGENIFYVQLEAVLPNKEVQENVDMPNLCIIMKASGNYTGRVKGLVYDLLNDAKNNELIEIIKWGSGYKVSSDGDGLFVRKGFPPLLFYLNEFSLEELAEK